jgi:cellulose/xylan binding protein with CBM9 domain/Big-like domain-containing protein/parallel beta helix pectate lyase-like protein
MRNLRELDALALWHPPCTRPARAKTIRAEQPVFFMKGRLSLIKSIQCALACAIVAASFAQPAPLGAQTATPRLPLVFLDTTYVSPTGSRITVSAGGDFQAALNTAQPGDVIQLQAGATFTGNFTLPNKSGNGWIYIQSAALGSLPAAGTRVGPVQAPLMPKIVTPNTSAAITAASGAHHFRFVGVEITGTMTGTSDTQFVLVALGSGTDVVLDRCYIHGTPTGNYKVGVLMNNARSAVIDSYLVDFHSTQQDAQAIIGYNGPGPFKLVNNYIEASGQNILFGGADPTVANLVPSDIEIRRNHLFKPLTWKVGDPTYAGIHWQVKNHLELKNAQRVLIDGNVIENNWIDAQGGTAVLFTVRNQDNTAPWSIVQDVTFTNNLVRYVGQSLGMHGWDDINQSQQSARILIRNNLLLDNVSSLGRGWLFSNWRGIVDLVIDHNTGISDQAVMMGGYGTNTRFAYTNNLAPTGAYGFAGDGTSQGMASLDAFFPGALFARNVLAGGNASLYPPDNFFPASLAAVGFVDMAGGNYQLAPGSPYKNAGTDGKDVGADLGAISAAVTGAPNTPAPSDTTAPTISITAPTSGTTVAGTVTVTASAADNVRVAGVQFKVDGANLGSEVAAAPYTASWSTSAIPDGTHTLSAVARDAAGNTSVAPSVSVTVVNGSVTPPPAGPTGSMAISGVTATSITPSSAAIVWTTDQPGDSQVEFGPTTAYGTLAPLNGTPVTGHLQTLTGLTAARLYHYRVRSRDASGALTTSGDFTFTTLSAAAVSDPANATTPGALRSYSTIQSIGIEWDVTGDPNHNATANTQYRVQGAASWKSALPLVRVDFNGTNMLAGSVLFLNPGTTYEVKLDLYDPDGGADSRTVTVATRPVPALPTGGRTFNVVPGSGGGDGSAGNPFRGIAAAQAIAQPGDIFLVHAGSYGGRIAFNKPGTAGNYIVWKGAGDGEALFAGIDIAASHIWLEGLTVRNQAWATFSIGAPDDVVLTRSTFVNNHYNIYLQQGGTNWYITDNDITGDNDPAAGSLDGEGIELNGSYFASTGHVVAYNRITRVADGISAPYSNVDIYGNDIFDVSDDGIELDPGRANIRVWGNRVHMALHNGISFQPQSGAPWYIIRNQLVGFTENPFKFRTVDRFVLLHNTIVNWGNMMPCCIDRDDILKAIAKNNLWISATGGAIWPMDNGTRKDWRTDLDSNGFDWGSSSTPFTYAGVNYPDLPTLAAASGLETHGIRVNKSTCLTTFNFPGPPPTSIPPQFMALKAGCNAIDAGTILANVNDGFTGSAPDLGAYEFGQPLPQYGPRPNVTPPAMQVFRTGTPISVDGALGEWNGAGQAAFSGLSGSANASLLWDDTNLYVAFRVTDSQLSSLQTTRDSASLWQDDAVEVYIDTRSDRAGTMQPDDYQLIVNINNVQADLRGTGNDKDASWNAMWPSAVAPLANGYAVEIAIPWAQIGVTPVAGMTLGIDLAVDNSNPTGTPAYETFDWAQIAPGPYAQPSRWKQVQLVGTSLPTTDRTPPTVAITSPSSGATVSGSIALAATASDNVGVAGVQFKLDGANLGAEDTTAPYTVTWNTGTVSSGSHTLTAVARDAAGNVTTSSTLTVTVANDTTAPTVSITSPTSGATFSTSLSPLTLSGTAADAVGVSQVTWTNDRGGSGTATGTTSWTAGGIVLQSGSNVLTVTARDAAGNRQTVTLTVTYSPAAALSVSITVPTSGATFNSNSFRITLGGVASSSAGVTQVTWRSSRGFSGTASGTTSWTAAGIRLRPGQNILTVTARDGAGNTATKTLTVTQSVAFSDDPIAPGSTPIKTVHLAELRSAADGVRDVYGLVAFEWSDPTLTPGVSTVRSEHLVELRAALNQTYQVAGMAPPQWTDATVPLMKTIKAVHVSELRTAVNGLR